MFLGMLMELLRWVAVPQAFAEAPPCPDPLEYVARAGDALLAGQQSEAQAAWDELEANFDCHGLPDAALLSQIWLTEGVRLHVLGDHSGAQWAFASSWRMQPQPWPARFGQTIQAVYDASTGLEGVARVYMAPLPEGLRAAVDGERTPLPAEVHAGAHVVQVVTEDDVVLLTRFVMLPPGEALEVSVDGLVPPQPQARSRPTGWLLGAGAAAALSGGMALLAHRQTAVMDSAASLSALDQAFGRQKTYAGLSYGLAGLSAVGVGIHVTR